MKKEVEGGQGVGEGVGERDGEEKKKRLEEAGWRKGEEGGRMRARSWGRILIRRWGKRKLDEGEGEGGGEEGGCTANERPVRIQYKCLVPIYVFPEIKLCSLVTACLFCCSQIGRQILGIFKMFTNT